MALGELHPDYLLEKLTARQLAEWEIYHSVEPFGEQQQFLQAGIVASTIANVNRGKNKSVFKPSEFMPVWEAKSKKQSVEEMIETMNQFNPIKKKRKVVESVSEALTGIKKNG